MSDQKDEKKTNRRDFLFTATAAAGAVGVGAAVWPLVDQMNPDASVKALASTEVDVSSMQPGQSLTVLWRGKPVFIKRRTEDEIKKARTVDINDLLFFIIGILILSLTLECTSSGTPALSLPKSNISLRLNLNFV